jgi:hypothetical protein
MDQGMLFLIEKEKLSLQKKIKLRRNGFVKLNCGIFIWV